MEIRENVALAPLTSFRIGGAAKFFCECGSENDLREAVLWTKTKDVPFFILGGGTNILMDDRGFPGLVIKCNLRDLLFEDATVRVGAGVSWMALLEGSASRSLAGLEWGAGIPGTVGGAVRGNAGAYGHSVGEYIDTVRALDAGDGAPREFSQKDCRFAYRESFFKTRPEYVILGATLRLTPGNRATLETEMREIIAVRNGKLPAELSAGSIFKNLELSDGSREDLLTRIHDSNAEERAQWMSRGKIPTGWLMEHCGLKGAKRGGAMVSPKHANTIVNTGNASAEDVIMLSRLMKQKVRDAYGIELEEEVEFVYNYEMQYKNNQSHP